VKNNNMSGSWALVFSSLDNLLIDNDERKKKTYLEIGWDEKSIKEYLKEKKNALQIASFNTARITFTASSRRNRYYEIYDRLDMLNYDQPYENAVAMLKEFVKSFKVFVISSRSNPHKDKTLDVMEKYGFPVDEMTIFFKETNQSLAQFRNQCIERIKEEYEMGIAVVNQPHDTIGFDRVGYSTVAIISITEKEDWKDVVEYVTKDWKNLAKIIKMLQPKEISGKSPVAAPVKEITPVSMPSFLQTSPNPTINSTSPPISSTPTPTSPLFESSPINTSVSVLDGDGEEEPNVEIHTAKRAETAKNTQSMLDQAVYHQLFMGNDRIMGAGENDSIEIPDVEDLLALFMLELKKRLGYITIRKLDEFFGYFGMKYQMNFADVQAIAEANMEGAAGLEGQTLGIMYMALAKFIESLRNQAFERWGLPQMKALFEELTGQPFGGPVIDLIQNKISGNDSKMMLLFNVSFISWLASIFPDHPTSQMIQEKITPRMRDIAIQAFL
jgi:hypothetical protein